MSLKSLLAVIGLAMSAVAAAQSPFVGKPAPKFDVTVLSADGAQPTSSADLQGNVVVLEFWATWCAPCIKAMPHLNELAEKFEGRPVKFLSVSAEDQETVRKFMQKRPFKTSVALIKDSVMRDDFKVFEIPTTWVIGKDGKVLAVTEPMLLTEEALEAAIADKPISLKPSTGVTTSSTPLKTLFEVNVSSSEGALFSAFGDGSFTMQGAPPQNLLSLLYNVPPARIRIADELPHAQYSITARWPSSMRWNAVLEVFKASVPGSMGVKCEWVEEEMEAYVVTAPVGPKGSLKPSSKDAKGSRTSSGGGSYAIENADISSLWRYLEIETGKPVVDETGLAGKFDFQLLHEVGDPESISAELAASGIQMKLERRKIRMLKVTKA
jgi:uncharacterized protein (TIGR03435 family)